MAAVLATKQLPARLGCSGAGRCSRRHPAPAAAAAAGGGAAARQPLPWRSGAPQQQQRRRQRRGGLVVTAAVKVAKGKQILCNKTLRAKEGSGEAVGKLCEELAAAAKQRISDRTSGVLAYEYSEDDYEPGTFHFMELYASQKSMAEHNERPEVASFVKKVQPLLEGPLGMVLYEYQDGKIGPACMEGDVKGEGGLDDATGANKYGGGASLKQTSAVVNLTNVKEKDDEEKGLWGMTGFKELASLFGGKKKEEKKK